MGHVVQRRFAVDGLAGFCLLCLACLLGSVCRAAPPATKDASPTYLVDHWTTADGLPVNGVNRVLLARSGYLWLATFDGLVRFDGHRFTVFRVGPEHPGFPGNRITSLIETPDGLLWLLTEDNRLARFDGQTFHTIGTADGLPDALVERIELDDYGSLRATTRAGLFHLRDGNRFVVQANWQDFGNVSSSVATKPDELWVATNTAAVQFHGDRLQRVLSTDAGIPLPVMSILRDRNERLWIASNTKLVREDDQGKFQPVLNAPGGQLAAAGDQVILDADFETMTVESNGVIERRSRSVAFAGTGRETLVRVAADASIWRNELDRLQRNGRTVFESPCKIIDFDFGADGEIWVATACNGLFELRQRHIFAIKSVDGIELGSVYSLAQAPNGALWITTLNQGVAIVSRDGQGTWLKDRDRMGPGLLVAAIGTDGETWVGSCRVYGAAECSTPIDWPESVGRAGTVGAIHRARDGSLWVGGAGLWRQTASGEWQDLSASAGLGDHTIGERVRAIREVDDGTLWFGTQSAGIVRRDPQGEFRRFTVADGLASNSVRALHVHKRQLWIATQDRGLCRMQQPASTNPRIACIDSTRGLWSDSLHQILFDDDGRMWLNSNSGIFALPVTSLDDALDGRAARVYPQVYTERSGLPSREGNGGVDNAGVRLADGRLAFPTQEGVAIFNPRDLPSSRAEVRAFFEHITVPNGENITITEQMTMQRGVRSLTLHYTSLAPRLTEPAYFRYRMAPNKAWIDLGDARQLSLAQLAPGEQTIELVAFGAGGEIGPAARLALHLPRYWYETKAFRTITPALFLLTGLLWIGYLRRVGVQRQSQLARTVAERTADLQGALSTIERLSMNKTRFFANVSHELRTPLALLIGPIDDYVGGRAPSKKLLGAMQRNAHRLERLIGQLLDLERLDAQRFPLRPQTLDLAVLADESVAAFRPLARNGRVALELRVPDQPVMVRGDSDQLTRVIGNLLSNALKFCPAGGHVEVTLENGDGNAARLRVDDSGPGITPDWRTRIFDRFSQMGSDATRAREGAGLGLALCREVAELHGGHLYATDSVLGGAGFVFELPLPSHSPLSEYMDILASGDATQLESAGDNGDARESIALLSQTSHPVNDDHQADQADAEPHSVMPADRPLVLLAEDNDDLRHYLSGVLSEHYRVTTAADGEMALDQARAESPDLIVTDLMMPNLDGLGLAQAIRSHDELAGVPIIFLTARAADADRVCGLDGGADYYLTKPVDSRVLLAQLAAALRTCQRLRQRYAQRAVTADFADEAAAKSEFVVRVDMLFEACAHAPEFGVPAMLDALHVSETVLRRRCRDEYQASPGDLLRRYRLDRAHGLLEQGAGNVSEVAYAVGYSSLAAFGRAYREQYGCSPTQSRPQS